MDATGSMLPWLREVTRTISELSRQLRHNYKHLTLRLAMVTYTDYDQPAESRTRKLDFTSDEDEFLQFVASIKSQGGVGGDEAEDVFGGLKVAVDLSWQLGTKVLIHIADAPAHGKNFHGHCIRDDYDSGDPAKIDEARLMLEVKKKGIHYWFGFIHKEKTDQMIKIFNATLRDVSDNKMMIEQFDARDREFLADAVYNSVSSSISTQVDELRGNGGQFIGEYSIDSARPNFENIDAVHSATTTSTDLECTPPRDLIKFKRGHNPFSQGVERLAFYGMDTLKSCLLVMKKFKKRVAVEDVTTSRRQYNQKNRERYERVLRAHNKAIMYSNEFNKRKPHGTPQIKFVPVTLMELSPDVDGRVEFYTCEPYIEGKYQKFNSNAGFVRTSSLLDAVQAFSHFSWCHSDQKLLICDIQGVRTDDGFILTDPAIHYVGSRRHYGSTDLGPKGIERFFDRHECNQVCTRMGLWGY